MKKTKPFINYCDMAMYPVTLGFTSNETKFHKELNRIGVTQDVEFLDEDSISTAHFLTSKFSHNIIVVIGREGEFKELATELLVHEAVHVWQYIKEVIGEDKAGDEIDAYNTQYITRFLLDEYKKGH
jgi:hypothetical protein